LQTSCDGGSTWTTVPGWDPGFAECVQEFVPVIGLPPNPGGESPTQFACSIAGYLANDVILKALTQAITSITDDISLLGFGTVLVDLIPEFVLVTLAFNAFTLIYTAVQEGTIADYEAARDDAELWQEVQCAIFSCIVTDGYVKPTNFACIVAQIAAIPYGHSDVIDTIVAFVNSLGAVGMAQLSQRAGLVPGADCSTCATWCHDYNFQVSDGGWVAIPSEDEAPAAAWLVGSGWQQYYPPTGGAQCRIKIPFLETSFVTGMAIFFFTSTSSSSFRVVGTELSGVQSYYSMPEVIGFQSYFPTFATDADTAFANINNNGDGTTITISRIVISGTGVDPLADFPCA